jgi:hypothetical protein
MRKHLTAAVLLVAVTMLVVTVMSFRKSTSNFQLTIGSSTYKIYDGNKEVYSIAVGQYPDLDKAIEHYNQTGEVSVPSSVPGTPVVPRKTF